jgi:hypothetical protein
MGAEEGRAFYWWTPCGSNGRFSSFHQYLAPATAPGRALGTGRPSAILADARVG